MRPRITFAVAFSAVALAIDHGDAHAYGGCPDGAVVIPRATALLGHARSPWGEHTESMPAFCIDRDETSYARLVECISAGACFPSNACVAAGGSVACLDALQAEEVCHAMGGSLPTEAEWEYAARGALDARVVWIADPDWRAIPSALTPELIPRSSFGLLRMTSGVREWTATRGPSAFAAEHIVKGRSPTAGPWEREPVEEHTTLPTIGFRCIYPIGTPTRIY